jgi:hypothetical protein
MHPLAPVAQPFGVPNPRLHRFGKKLHTHKHKTKLLEKRRKYSGGKSKKNKKTKTRKGGQKKERDFFYVTLR